MDLYSFFRFNFWIFLCTEIEYTWFCISALFAVVKRVSSNFMLLYCSIACGFPSSQCIKFWVYSEPWLLNTVILWSQATVGPCNVPKPRGWNPIEQSKWTRFAIRLFNIDFNMFLKTCFTNLHSWALLEPYYIKN